MGASLFISHSMADSGLARQVAESLQQQGYETILADELPKGSKWTDALRTNLERSNAAVVIASDASLNSRFVMFELGAFQAANKPVVAIRPAGSDAIPETSPLAMYHAIDVARLSSKEIAETIRAQLDKRT